MTCRFPSIFIVVLLLCSCQRETQVEKANREGILLVGNSAEPKSLDLHLVSGVIESKIIDALFEGLVGNDPALDEGTRPGAAVSWEHNEAMTDWTFHLQPEAKWSDGKPVTAQDFVFSYHRLLHPDLGASYADMLYFLENAESYNKNLRGEILVKAGLVPGLSWEAAKAISFKQDPQTRVTDLGKNPRWQDASNDEKRLRFVKNKGLDALKIEALSWLEAEPMVRYPWPPGISPEAAKALLSVMRQHVENDLFSLAGVGVQAVDALTLRVKLREPVPYLPTLTRHYTWFPVPEHIVLRHGKIADRDNQWFTLGRMVGNGPFKLTKWRFHDVIECDQNPFYWDKKNVGLHGIRFFPIENNYTESRAFLAGQLHTTYQLPSDLIRSVKAKTPEFLRQEPYVGNTFIRFNVNRRALADPRVRQALSLTVNRQEICDYIQEGFLPATSFTPKIGNYVASPVLTYDPVKARQLLAEAGFPNGDGFPRFTIIISKPSARAQAEAIQAMWKAELHIIVDIQNVDWGSYISAQQNLDYDMALAAWVGDYLDPSTFLNMWTKGNGNNNTGWSSEKYEAMLRQAAYEAVPAPRLALFQDAESLLMRDQPILPISFYVRNYLHRPEVKNWYPLLLDHHPWKNITLGR